MEFPEILNLVSRYLHIVAMATMLGATAFMRFSLHPSTEELAPDDRKKLRDTLRRRWSLFVHAMIVVILLTGSVNFYLRFAEVKPMPYHALFGVKLLLGLVLFFIASALVGRSRGLQPIRDRAPLFMNINLLIALILIGVALAMRNAPIKTPVVDQPSSTVVRPVATSNSANMGIIIATTA